MFLKIENFLKKYGIYLVILLCLVLGILSLKFQNASLDDDLYLHETAIMADVLKSGKWIGNYGVGIHGFLFKLPVALIFLLTGPSLTVATIWTILLACLSLYLFYLILKKLFGNNLLPLSGVLLLFTNFQFILNYPTYMREIPVLLSLLYLFYLILSKKSYWLVGLSLLLVLDAKESIFFMIVPGLVIGILINEWSGFNWKGIQNYIKVFLKVLTPTIIYLSLMLSTSILPLNTAVFTVVPGVTEGGVEYQLKHFEKEAATQSIIRLDNPEAATMETVLSIDEEEQVGLFRRIFNVFAQYLGKIIYPRTFSFLSIPSMIFFPAFFTSIILFKEFIKKKKVFLISSSLMLWSFIAIYILRLSFDRYLFPITPIVIIFFLLFLTKVIKKEKMYTTIWLLSSLLAISTLFFEAGYVMVKVVLTAIFIVLILLNILFKSKWKNISFYTCLLLSIISLGVSSFFYYSSGQYHYYELWGRNYGVKEVVALFDRDEKIMLNDIGWDLLPGVYRGDNKRSPEWKWSLKEWVPRKKNLKSLDKYNTYPIYGRDIEEDREIVKEYGIQKIGLVISKLPEYKFAYEERLEDYKNASWLELSSRVDLKNKEIYIFQVRE